MTAAASNRNDVRACARHFLADHSASHPAPTPKQADRDTAPSGEPTAPCAVGGEGNPARTIGQHTPGPWCHEADGPFATLRILGADGEPVATVLGQNERCAENCNLIAAAPDLLAVARAALARLAAWSDFTPEIQELRAAIAKAEGRQ